MSAIHRQEDGQELIKVGKLYLIWKETSEQRASSPMQSAQSQGIFPDLQQRINSPNYNPVTLPTTVTRSGNRRSTFARAINTHPQLEIRGTTVSRSISNHDFDKVVNAQGISVNLITVSQMPFQLAPNNPFSVVFCIGPN